MTQAQNRYISQKVSKIFMNKFSSLSEYLSKNGFLDYTLSTFCDLKHVSVLYNHDLINKRLMNLEKYELTILKSRKNNQIKNSVRFSIIYFLYDTNIEYIKNSLNSIFSQDITNIEIILILNGIESLEDNKKEIYFNIIQSVIKNIYNVQIINVMHNLWNPQSEDSDDPFVNLWNLGVLISNSDYVAFLSYDDQLSINYCSEMIQLFISNSNCVSAAPLPVSIDHLGKINSENSKVLKNNNSRTKYTLGRELVRDFINHGKKISFPGEIMSFKRDHLIRFGGIDGSNDISQIVRLNLVGLSGFSPEAKLYWRHHSQQTNKIWSMNGYIFSEKLVKTILTEELHKLYKDQAEFTLYDELKVFVREASLNYITSVIKKSSLTGGFKPSLSALKQGIGQEKFAIQRLIFVLVFIKYNILRILFKLKYFIPKNLRIKLITYLNSRALKKL